MVWPFAVIRQLTSDVAPRALGTTITPVQVVRPLNRLGIEVGEFGHRNARAIGLTGELVFTRISLNPVDRTNAAYHASLPRSEVE